MKWLLRTLVTLMLALFALAAYALSTARYADQRVGFQVRQTADRDGRIINIGIWYPTTDLARPTSLLGAQLLSVAPDGEVKGERLPVVVLSHGNGGGLASHADLAMDLASAGYVAAAVMHPGDNHFDQRAAGAASLFSDRARHLRLALDYLLGAWPDHSRLDAERIGAFGFSAGGTTVMTLLGAQPDFDLLPAHCTTTPEFICQVLEQVHSPLRQGSSPAVGEFVADARIRAAVLATPGLGFAFNPTSLQSVVAPVQLWSGNADQHVPAASNALRIRDQLPDLVELHEVTNARHVSFLAPCGLLKPAALCDDAPGFDRDAFHSDMNAKVLAFFNTTLDFRNAQ